MKLSYDFSKPENARISIGAQKAKINDFKSVSVTRNPLKKLLNDEDVILEKNKIIENLKVTSGLLSIDNLK